MQIPHGLNLTTCEVQNALAENVVAFRIAKAEL